MSVRTKDLSYSVGAASSRVRLLDPTSVTCPASAVTAIMGPSGAGKTTLMDLLSGTKTTGYYSGDIFIGGEPVPHSELKWVVAHVECFDFHIEEFTVLENMYHTAMLRVGRWMSHEECLGLCLEVADILSLTAVKDVVVGSELKKGISGGQKKLLSIANELLAFPTVICMDEPTSGLDSTTSLQLAKVLQDLALNHHKTIICTIHQPTEEMLKAWQSLILIGKGNIVYDGPIVELDDHICRLGYTLPSPETHVTSVEYMVHLLSDDNEVQSLISAWKQNSNKVDHSISESSSEEVVSPRKTLPLHYQILVLTRRHALYTWRTLHGVKGMFGRNLLGGIFYGIVYYRNGNELSKLRSFASIDRDGITLSPYVYNTVTACFAVTLFVVVINMVPIPSMFAMARYCNKEQANKLYSSFAKWLSLILIDLPTLFFGTCLFILLMYEMSGTDQDWYKFSYVVMFASFLGYGQAQLCAHISPSAISGLIYMTVLSGYQLIFSGYFVEQSELPEGLRWAVYSSFMRWSTGQLMMNQFGGYLRRQGDIVLQLFEYEHFKFSKSSLILAMYFLGLEIFILLMLYFPKPTATHVEDVDTEDKSAVHKSPLHRKSRDNSNGLVCQKEEPHQHASQAPVDDFNYEKDDVFKAAKTLPRSRIVDFQFQQVTYTLTGKLGSSKGKELLKGVDGAVNAGELCAVMGMSGSGKTTLLNVLSGRANAGVVGGAIYANSTPFPGMKMANSMARPLEDPTYAYVMQEDAHFPLFTVEETLTFAAMLRKRTADENSVRVMVQETLNVLGLAHIADHYVGVIGDSMISRGQLRRLTVGVEIVNSPSLIFLDEPTTGLDSFLAETVVKGLKAIAESKRTVICTIHSPSPSIFFYFDKLLLLSEGHVLFFGPANECKQYLISDCGFEASDMNPADFVIHAAKITKDCPEKCEHSLDHYAAMAKKKFYSSSDVIISGQSNSRADSVTGPPPATLSEKIAASMNADIEDIKKSGVTIKILLKRETLKEIRRYKFWLTNFVRAAAFGCLLGFVWGDLTPDGTILNYTGLNLVMFIAVNLWMVELVPKLQDDKVIFYREREANATSTFASWIVMGLPTSFALFFITLVLLLTVYNITDMKEGMSYFAEFFFALYIQLIANLQLGVFVSTFTPNTMVNVLIFPSLTLTIQAMLCGYAAMITTFKPWFRWITYIIPAKWYMGILFINQLKNNDNLAADFDSILSDYGWDYPMLDQFVYLFLILVAHKILAYLGMRYLTSARQ